MMADDMTHGAGLVASVADAAANSLVQHLGVVEEELLQSLLLPPQVHASAARPAPPTPAALVSSPAKFLVPLPFSPDHTRARPPTSWQSVNGSATSGRASAWSGAGCATNSAWTPAPPPPGPSLQRS